jgi:molecular chaperone GrpE (heat shock protein)
LKTSKVKLEEEKQELQAEIDTIATLKEQPKTQQDSLVSLQADFDYLKVVFKFNDRLPTYL